MTSYDWDFLLSGIRDNMTRSMGHFRQLGFVPLDGEFRELWNVECVYLRQGRLLGLPIPDDIVALEQEFMMMPQKSTDPDVAALDEYVQGLKLNDAAQKQIKLKISRSDSQMRNQLRELLQYCRDAGHKPLTDSTQYAAFYRIKRVLIDRKNTSCPIPGDIIAMMDEVKAFPSAPYKKDYDKLKKVLQYCHDTGHMPESNSKCNRVWCSVVAMIKARKKSGFDIPDDIVNMMKTIQSFPGARNCSNKKRENRDARLRTDLTNIVNQCRALGYAPPADTELGDVWQGIITTLQVRRTKNLYIPDDIVALFNEIKAFPSVARFQKQEVKRQLVAQERVVQSRLEKLTRVFPRVKVLRMVYGDDAFRQLVMTDVNPFATKIMCETLNRVLENIISVYKSSSRRNLEMFLTYVDGNADVYDLDAPDKLPLPDVADDYMLTKQYAYQIHGKIIRRLKHSINPNLFSAYLRGDVDGMIACLDEKWQKIYKFQRANNLTDVPTNELVDAGRMMDKTNPRLTQAVKFCEIYKIPAGMTNALNIAGACMQHLSSKKQRQIATRKEVISEKYPQFSVIQYLFGTPTYNFIMENCTERSIKMIVDSLDDFVKNQCVKNVTHNASAEKLYSMIFVYMGYPRITNDEISKLLDKQIMYRLIDDCTIYNSDLRATLPTVTGVALLHLSMRDWTWLKNFIQDTMKFVRAGLLPLINACIKGDAKTLLDALPDAVRAKYQNEQSEFMHEYKIPNGVKNELNIAGRWLAEHMDKVH